jgi:hypothetical protein
MFFYPFLPSFPPYLSSFSWDIVPPSLSFSLSKSERVWAAMYMRVKMKFKVLYGLYGLFEFTTNNTTELVQKVQQTTTHPITQKPWRTRPSQQRLQAP